MSKLKSQMTATWEHFLLLDKEREESKQYIEKSPIEEAVKVLHGKFHLKQTTAYQIATKIVRNLVEQRYIETVHGSGPGNKTVAFKVINRSFSFKNKDSVPPPPTRVPSVGQPTEDFEVIVRRIVKSEFAAQREIIAADEARRQKNIVVYIDTVNLYKACKEMKIMMPIEELLQELQRFGKVIQSYAFYNAGCPDEIIRIFLKYDCLPIGCIDNKKDKGPRISGFLDSLVQKNGPSPLMEEKYDWIDSYIDRTVRANVQLMQGADIHVIVSGDRHFEPLFAKIRQAGKKAIKCHADAMVKKVYFTGDCAMTQIPTRAWRS